MSDASTRLAAALADRYRIERELGAGGMATVYLAADLKHDRKVAIKVLKPELAAVLGAERFVQEIKTTAALSHPHILPLFDSGEADGFLYYVMPYIQGETIREKLNRETQFGIDEAVKITTEIADALDYAHRHGVIHRDIKPENILLHDGRPMVMDFGIALAVSAAAGGRMTETGLSLGTPHYMSPEQATADRTITARSDTYSLASVLYEMLTGNPPHVGSSAQQIIMKIIAERAQPVTELRASVPPNVAAAVAKALEKLPADRFDTAKSFAGALADLHFRTDGTAGAALESARFRRAWIRDPRSWAALAAIAVLGGVALSPATRARQAPALSPVIRFVAHGPDDSTYVAMRPANDAGWNGPVVAPDGRHVVIPWLTSSGTVLSIRSVDSLQTLELAGSGPFFSPSGDHLAFFRSSEVWTLDLGRPVPARVGALPEVAWDLNSAAWHSDGRLLVTTVRGLWALPARGGEASLLVAADSAAGERFLRIGVLDDGRLLLNVEDGRGRHLEVFSADGQHRTRIMPGVEDGQVVGDVLIFRQAGQDRAVRFDLRRLVAIGEPMPLPALPEGLLARSIAWPDSSAASRLEPVWVTREGSATPVGIAKAYYRWPRVSPDGGRIAINQVRIERAIIVTDLARGTETPLDGHSEPVWSPDGRWLMMSTGNRPFGGLLVQEAGGQAPDTVLSLDRGDSWPTSISPDGRVAAYYGATSGEGDANDPGDLFFFDLAKRESRRLPLPGDQRAARFSPDGHWVAYQSSESGRIEVYLRPWPALDASYLISAGGGTEPIWSRDGRELYYRHDSEVMAVTIAERAGRIERTRPRLLFTGPFAHDQNGDQSWDLAPDGRFLMLRPVPGGRAVVQVALNWIDGIRARLEAGR